MISIVVMEQIIDCLKVSFIVNTEALYCIMFIGIDNKGAFASK